MTNLKNLFTILLIASLSIYQSCNQCKDDDTDDIGQWIHAGPQDVPGRTTALLLDSRHPDKKAAYAGSPGGGLWYKEDIENDNNLWTQLNSQATIISCIAQNPRNPDQIYFGTGVQYFDYLGHMLRGNGIYRSVQTTTQQPFSVVPFTHNNADFRYVNDIEIHWGTGHIYVATSTGLHLSQDSALTFTKVIDHPVSDVQVLGDQSIVAVNGISSLLRSNASDFIISRSTDGISWSPVLTEDPNCTEPECAKSRRSLLAYSLGTLYALRTGGAYLFLYKSEGFGAEGTWQKLGQLQPEDPTKQVIVASNHLSLMVDPVDKDQVFTGSAGLHGWNTTDNSVNERQVPYQDMVDVHSMSGSRYISNNFSVGRMVFGTDVGIFRMTRDPNGILDQDLKSRGYNTPLVMDAVAATNTKLFAAGVWDHAGYVFKPDGSMQYELPGFAGGNGVSGESKKVYYNDEKNVSIISGFNGTNCNLYRNDTFLGDVSLSFLGVYDYSNRVHYGVGQKTIEVTTLRGDDLQLRSVATYTHESVEGSFSVVRYDPFRENAIFLGTSEGRIYVYYPGNATNPEPISIFNEAGEAYEVIDISVGDAGGNLVALLRHKETKATRIWARPFAEASWSDVTADLPEMTVMCLLHEPGNQTVSRVLIGTENGIWRGGPLTQPGIFSWAKIIEVGLPSAPVVKLSHQSCSNMLVAGIYGQGVFYYRYP